MVNKMTENDSKKYKYDLGILGGMGSEATVEIYTTGSVESALANMKWFKAEHKPVTHVDID